MLKNIKIKYKNSRLPIFIFYDNHVIIYIHIYLLNFEFLYNIKMDNILLLGKLKLILNLVNRQIILIENDFQDEIVRLCKEIKHDMEIYKFVTRSDFSKDIEGMMEIFKQYVVTDIKTTTAKLYYEMIVEMMKQDFIESEKHKKAGKGAAGQVDLSVELTIEKEIGHRMIFTLEFTKLTVEKVIKTIIFEDSKSIINKYSDIKIELLNNINNLYHDEDSEMLSKKIKNLEINENIYENKIKFEEFRLILQEISKRHKDFKKILDMINLIENSDKEISIINQNINDVTGILNNFIQEPNNEIDIIKILKGEVKKSLVIKKLEDEIKKM